MNHHHHEDGLDSTVYSMDRAKRNLCPDKPLSDWSSSSSSSSHTRMEVTPTTVTFFFQQPSGDNKVCQQQHRVFRDNTRRVPCADFNDNIYGDSLPTIPTVLTGACQDWKVPHLSHWADDEAYASRLVSLDGGPAAARQSLGVGLVTLREYARYCHHAADRDETPLYVFDAEILKGTVFDPKANDATTQEDKNNNNSKNNEDNPDYFQDCSIPPCFSQDQMQYLRNDRFRPLPPAWLLIGVTGSGTPIHNHPMTVAWNALTSGAKLWCCVAEQVVWERGLLLRGRQTNNNSGSCDDDDDDDYALDLSALEWFQQCHYDDDTFDNNATNSSSDTADTFIIVQQPGEVVFVPAGWYHVVVNLRTSMAISVSLTLRKDVKHCMEVLRASDDDEFATYWEEQLGLELGHE